MFCDNSGYSLDEQYYRKIASEKRKEFEYLSFNGDYESTIKYGKGYGEGEIMNYVINNSQLLNNENSFSKITGRLIIKNINKLIKNENKNYFMNQVKNYKVDTRFYHVNKQFFMLNLIDSYKNVNDNNGYYLEHAYSASLKKTNNNYRSFYQKPFFYGESGSTGNKYNGLKNIRWFIISILCYLNLYNKIK